MDNTDNTDSVFLLSVILSVGQSVRLTCMFSSTYIERHDHTKTAWGLSVKTQAKERKEQERQRGDTPWFCSCPQGRQGHCKYSPHTPRWGTSMRSCTYDRPVSAAHLWCWSHRICQYHRLQLLTKKGEERRAKAWSACSILLNSEHMQRYRVSSHKQQANKRRSIRHRRRNSWAAKKRCDRLEKSVSDTEAVASAIRYHSNKNIKY